MLLYGHKNAFSVLCPSTRKRFTRCKIYGITLNYEHSNIENFIILRDIMKDTTAVHINNPMKIKRKHGVVVVCTMLSLKSAELCSNLTTNPRGKIHLF